MFKGVILCGTIPSRMHDCESNPPEPGDQEPFTFLLLAFHLPWANHVTSPCFDFVICKGIYLYIYFPLQSTPVQIYQ